MGVDADLRAAYADGELITPSAGDAFRGFFNIADSDSFDGAAQAGDYQLRYILADAVLTVGTVLTILGAQYRVPEDPERINDGRECVVRLREVTA